MIGLEQIEQCAAQECGHMEAALRDLAIENEPNPAKIDTGRNKKVRNS